MSIWFNEILFVFEKKNALRILGSSAELPEAMSFKRFGGVANLPCSGAGLGLAARESGRKTLTTEFYFNLPLQGL